MDLCKKTKEHPDWVNTATVAHVLFVDSIYRLAYRKLDEGGSYLLETPPQRLLRTFYLNATDEEKETLSEVHACIEQFGQGRHTNNNPLGVFVLMYNVMNGMADRLQIMLHHHTRALLGTKVLKANGTLTKDAAVTFERAVAHERMHSRPFYAVNGRLSEAPEYRCVFRPSPDHYRLYAHLSVAFPITQADVYCGHQKRVILLADVSNGILSRTHKEVTSRRTDWTESEVRALKIKTSQLRDAYEQSLRLADEFPNY